MLDLSRFIAGPICAQTLADFGAEVVKIERPDGEDSRHHEPYYEGESLYTMLYNRNKYGATLDTRHPKAPGILRSLVEWADVVVENYRPGTMEKMGLGYERMAELKPGVILVSISGFGQSGPLSRRALFDAISQASSGLMSVTGEEDGPPTLAGTYVADYLTGYQAAIGAFAALSHKKETGEGQHVDVASLDSMFSILGIRLISHLMLGADMPRSGSRDLLTARSTSTGAPTATCTSRPVPTRCSPAVPGDGPGGPERPGGVPHGAGADGPRGGPGRGHRGVGAPADLRGDLRRAGGGGHPLLQGRHHPRGGRLAADRGARDGRGDRAPRSRHAQTPRQPGEDGPERAHRPQGAARRRRGQRPRLRPDPRADPEEIRNSPTPGRCDAGVRRRGGAVVRRRGGRRRRRRHLGGTGRRRGRRRDGARRLPGGARRGRRPPL
ncbi:CoA transferase [Streptomyces sp. M19]